MIPAFLQHRTPRRFTITEASVKPHDVGFGIRDDQTHATLTESASDSLCKTQKRVHWMRNALAHAPTKSRAAVAAMPKTIFAQQTKADAAGQ